MPPMYTDSQFSSLMPMSPTLLHLVAVKHIHSKCQHFMRVHFSWVQMETPDGTQNLADPGYIMTVSGIFFLGGHRSTATSLSRKGH